MIQSAGRGAAQLTAFNNNKHNHILFMIHVEIHPGPSEPKSKMSSSIQISTRQTDDAAPPSGDDRVWMDAAALVQVPLAAGLGKYPRRLRVPPGSPEALPVQMGSLIRPVCSGSVLSLRPVGRVQKNLHREKFWSDGQKPAEAASFIRVQRGDGPCDLQEVKSEL